MSAFAESLRSRAGARRRSIVFPEAGDPRTIAAVVDLVGTDTVSAVLLGEPGVLAGALREAGVDPDRVTVADPSRDPRRDAFADLYEELLAARGRSVADPAAAVTDPLIFGAMLVRTGAVDGSVAGAVYTTPEVLRAAIGVVGTREGIRVVSSSFYMAVPGFRGVEEEVLTFTDAGVIPDPDAGQLVDIAHAAALERRRIVGDTPRVAFLSYSTRGSAAGESVTKMREAVEAFRRRLPEVPADGELQADAALIADVARRKAPDSPLAGNANVLVFPDLDAGNIAYKLVQRLARATAVGPILQGVARPFNDLSRGADAADIANVACVTALQAG